MADDNDTEQLDRIDRDCDACIAGGAACHRHRVHSRPESRAESRAERIAALVAAEQPQDASKSAEHPQDWIDQAIAAAGSGPTETMYGGAYELYVTERSGVVVIPKHIDDTPCWTLEEAREVVERHAAMVRGHAPRSEPAADSERTDEWKCPHCECYVDVKPAHDNPGAPMIVAKHYFPSSSRYMCKGVAQLAVHVSKSEPAEGGDASCVVCGVSDRLSWTPNGYVCLKHAEST